MFCYTEGANTLFIAIVPIVTFAHLLPYPMGVKDLKSLTCQCSHYFLTTAVGSGFHGCVVKYLFFHASNNIVAFQSASRRKTKKSTLVP